MTVDYVAEASRCLLKFNFGVVSRSRKYSCHHDVLKKEATPRTLLQWYIESMLLWQPMLGTQALNALGASSSAGWRQEGAVRAWGAAGLRWEMHRLSSLHVRQPKLGVPWQLKSV